MQAVARDPSGGPTQHGVGPRRAIGTEDLDRPTVAEVSIDVIEQVEQPGVQGNHLASSEVAHEPVQSPQPVELIVVAGAVGDPDLLLRVEMVKREDARPLALSPGESRHGNSR